jgi:GT2 family glycosyltransferase
MTPEAEVVIPSFNRVGSLRRTLDSLRGQTEAAAVTVVDNGSSDDTLAILARDYPEVRCHQLASNLGFGTAVNRGIEASDARLVILLNNDTVVPPEFIERVLAEQRRSGAEMVACCLREPSGRIESLGVEVDRALVAYDVWHGEPYERLAVESPPEALAPSGGAAGYLREAVLAVGGFDEELFAYLEDVELGIRMRLAGMSCATAADAFAWHEHSGTLGSGAEAKNRLMGRSRAYLLWKYGRSRGWPARMRGALIDGVTYGGQLLIDRNAGALRGRLEERRRLANKVAPPLPAGIGRLPYVRRGAVEGLRMRLARRRPRA